MSEVIVPNGELRVSLPASIPLPVEVLDADLAPVARLVPGASASLAPGIYAVTAPLPDGSPFRQAVRVEPSSSVTVELPMGADERATRRRAPRWWLDYVALSHPHAAFARPVAEVRESGTRPDGRLRTVIDFGRDPGDGFLLISTGEASRARTMVRLPPAGGALEVVAGPERVRGRGLLGESAAASAASRLADRGYRTAAAELLMETPPEQRSPLLDCMLGFLQLRTGVGPMPWLGRPPGKNDLADAWVLDGHVRRRSGDHNGARESLLVALELGIPVLSDAVSFLLSGLRHGIPTSLERPDGSLARRLDGLARLAGDADLAKTVFTVTGTEPELLERLSACVPPDARLVPPTETRAPIGIPDLIGMVVPSAVPWRPAGIPGELLVTATRLPSLRARRAGRQGPVGRLPAGHPGLIALGCRRGRDDRAP
jgi:hypothetical protein